MTRWTNGLARLWVSIGLLVTPMLVVPAPAVHAAGTLTASPTEVFVADAATLGKTTLTWNSGSAEAVQVYVRVGSNAFVPTGLGGPSGTGEYKIIQYGQTYTFSLFGANGQALPSGPSVVVTVKLVDRGETGCMRECIRGVNIKEGGTVADVHIETTVPAGVLIQASADPPNANGSCKSTGLVSTVWKPQHSKVFDGRLTDLEPNTTYCLKAIAKDAAGNEDTTYRTFKTQNRYVTVIFEKIKIISAGGDEDDGEWTFWFWVNGTKVDSFGQLSFSDGLTVDLAQHVKSYKTKNNGKWIDVTVLGEEDDTGPFGGVIPATGPEHAHVVKKVFVGGPDKYPTYNDGESFMGNFDWTSVGIIPSDENKFSVQGVYLVQYEP